MPVDSSAVRRSPVACPVPVGLGVWPGDAVGLRRRDAVLERLLWHGAGVGVQWIDTSHSDEGDIEQSLGRWLAALPEDAVPAVMTKGGVLPDGAECGRGTACVLQPSVLQAHLDASLAALGLDAVDTFLLHHPDETGVLIEESWSATASMAAAGKAARIGLCGFELDALRRCEAVRHVDVCMTRVDPFTLDAQLPLLTWCAAKGTDVIAWVAGDESLAFDPAYVGPLAGTQYDAPKRKLERVLSLSVSAEVAALGAVQSLAREAGVTREAVVRAWLLSQPGVTGVVVGAESSAQLDRWLADEAFALSQAAARRIAAAGERCYSGVSTVSSLIASKGVGVGDGQAHGERRAPSGA